MTKTGEKISLLCVVSEYFYVDKKPPYLCRMEEKQAAHHRTEGRLTKSHVQITYVTWNFKKLPRAGGKTGA